MTVNIFGYFFNNNLSSRGGIQTHASFPALGAASDIASLSAYVGFIDKSGATKTGLVRFMRIKEPFSYKYLGQSLPQSMSADQAGAVFMNSLCGVKKGADQNAKP